MKSPLAVDKATVKEFKIPKDIELHPRQKIAFLENQLHELKVAQWRARVDVVHATRLTESPIEALKNKGFNNMTEYKNQVAQFTGAISMIQTMIEELRAENPAVGETTSSDQLEG